MSERSSIPNVDGVDPVARLRAEVEQTLDRIRSLPDDAAMTGGDELSRLIAWTNRCAEELLAAARADADGLVRRAEEEATAILRAAKNTAGGLDADGREALRSQFAALQLELTAEVNDSPNSQVSGRNRAARDSR